MVENSKPGVLTADFVACLGFDQVVDKAARVKCPVTIVIGTGDKMTRPKNARSLATAFDAVDVVELNGVGHMMMHEDPRSVRAVLQSVATR